MKLVLIKGIFSLDGASSWLNSFLNSRVGMEIECSVIFFERIDQDRSGLCNFFEENPKIEVFVLGAPHYKYSPYHLLKLWMVLRSLKPDIILNLLPHIEPFVFAYSWLYGVRNFLRLGTIYSRQNTFVQWVNFVSLKLGDPVITVSNAVTESLLRKIPDARVFEISAGVDEKKFIPSQGFKPSIFTFVAVGRLIQAKGFEVLIDAIRVLLNGGCSTEFRVLIAGDGHLRSRLIQKRKDLDLEMILEFCGKVTDVKGLYARSTAFVLSSLWEGMPNSLLEAMAMELPVIASNLPQLSNCVTSENGWIFETGNADDLAKYMRIALESPKALLGHLGKNSRGKILTHYSMSVMVDQYSSVLQID